MEVDSSNPPDWRYEIKFNLIQEDELPFLEWMAGTPDFHRVHATRRVNSVYFDSADYHCAIANLDGIGWRSKFRIRWYGGQAQPKTATFEAKIRRGRLGVKQTCPVEMNGADPLALPQRKLDEIFRQVTLSGQVMAPLENLSPVLFVTFERDYYQGMNGVRLTLDRGLCFRNLTDEQGVGETRTHPDSRLVLEFKFAPDRKDQVAEIMSEFPFSATRNSKYILGLSHTGKAIYF